MRCSQFIWIYKIARARHDHPSPLGVLRLPFDCTRSGVCYIAVVVGHGGVKGSNRVLGKLSFYQPVDSSWAGGEDILLKPGSPLDVGVVNGKGVDVSIRSHRGTRIAGLSNGSRMIPWPPSNAFDFGPPCSDCVYDVAGRIEGGQLSRYVAVESCTWLSLPGAVSVGIWHGSSHTGR